MTVRTRPIPWTQQPQKAARPSVWAVSRGLWTVAHAPTRGSIFGPQAAEVGGPALVPVEHGLAWSFAGAGDYVDLGAPPDGPLTVVIILLDGGLANNFPFSTRTNSTLDGVEILSTVGGTAGTAYARLDIGTVSATTAATGLNDGRFHVHAVTHDGTTLRHYVDGVLRGSVSKSGTAVHSQNLRIASRGVTYFQGQVSDLAWFSANLGADDIRRIGSVAEYYSALFEDEQIVVPVAASAPTFNPAWARAANTVLHPGVMR